MSVRSRTFGFALAIAILGGCGSASDDPTAVPADLKIPEGSPADLLLTIEEIGAELAAAESAVRRAPDDSPIRLRFRRQAFTGIFTADRLLNERGLGDPQRRQVTLLKLKILATAAYCDPKAFSRRFSQFVNDLVLPNPNSDLAIIALSQQLTVDYVYADPPRAETSTRLIAFASAHRGHGAPMVLIRDYAIELDRLGMREDAMALIARSREMLAEHPHLNFVDEAYTRLNTPPPETSAEPQTENAATENGEASETSATREEPDTSAAPSENDPAPPPFPPVSPTSP